MFEKFRRFPRKTSGETAFLNKVAGYWECSSRKFMKFSEQLSQEALANASFCNYLSLENNSIKIYFSKNISFDLSHLCFDIQWHVFPGIKCITDVQELNI